MECKKLKLAKLVFGVFILAFGQSVLANQCVTVFPGVLQSHSAGQKIQFHCGSKVVNDTDGILPSSNVQNPPPSCATKSCGGANCVASGIPVSKLNMGPFQVSSNAGGNQSITGVQTLDGNGNQVTDYRDVTIEVGGELNFSPNPSGTTVYRFRQLTLKDGAILKLQPGDYWIDDLKLLGDNTIEVVGTEGTARIFANKTVDTNHKQTWNVNGSASRFFMYGYAHIYLGGPGSQLKGAFYATNDFDLKKDTILMGAATAESIHMLDTSTAIGEFINYDEICDKINYFEVIGPPTEQHNCRNSIITVRARNADNGIVTDYVGTISVDTQNNTGTWVSTTGNGAFSGGTPDGKATYQFALSDSGAVTFELEYPETGSTPIVVKVNQINDMAILGLSDPINFVYTNFLITGTPGGPLFVDTQIAAQEFTLHLTKLEGNTCTPDEDFDGDKDVRFWTNYINPVSGTIETLVNGTTVASSETATQTSQSITFVDGISSIIVRYDDAGKLKLSAEHDDGSAPPPSPGGGKGKGKGGGSGGSSTIVSGSTGNFVVKPLKFIVNIPGNSAQQVLAPVSAAVSACLSNAPFRKAGEGFGADVQPVNALNVVTPNYGNEIVPEGVVLDSGTLLAPNPGRNGSANTGAIGNAIAFSKITTNSGPFSQAPYFTGSGFFFDEVGCIQLNANVASGSYLGAGNVNGFVVLGRFIPDHFSVSGNVPQFETGHSSPAGSFTYLDQPFTYSINAQPVMTVRARAKGNTTTQNYNGAFWKLGTTGLGVIYNKAYHPVIVSDTIPSLPISIGVLPVFTDGGNGTGDFDFTEGSGIRIQRQDSTLVPPFNAEIQLHIETITDSEGVACTGTGCVAGGFNFGETTIGNGISFSGTGGGKTFYHGRLTLLESSGAELLPASLPMQIEYYTTGNGFILNGIDSMTDLSGIVNFTLTPSTGLLTTPSLVGTVFQNGALSLDLTAPNVAGYVDVELDLSNIGANLPWLQYNWPYAEVPVTNFSLNPQGRVTFGIFEGEGEVIYEQEVFP